VIKKLSKYFSLILILVLINSNFSFAITHMMCNMSKTQENCECKDNSDNHTLQSNSKESDCCKITSKEINNTNNLNLNKLKQCYTDTFQTLNYFTPSIAINNTHQSYYSFKNHPRYKPDIIILISRILI